MSVSGIGSDAEAEHCFRMTERLSAPGRERRNVPAPLRKKRFQPHEEGGKGRVNPLHRYVLDFFSRLARAQRLRFLLSESLEILESIRINCTVLTLSD